MLIMNCNSNKKYRSKAQSPPAERRLRRLHFIGDFAENGKTLINTGTKIRGAYTWI